ncbi:MAG: hypothetical protein A2Y78_06970 [Acidobacteria bacterium RBG_13_68_16]|jgi:hypothetical protein|nr:MAG: hypothetical protein A2Y78_06970 [Acidobacteria bacterium RBG_13_68_16]
MAAHDKPPVGLRLWPQTYSVARLLGVPDPLPRLSTADAPVALIVGHDEVSLLAPEEVVRELGSLVERASEGWRAFTVEAVVPLETIGLLAVASRALADVGVPVMVFSSHDTDHFLVPARFLGRALAVLNQAGLERFLPER